MMLDAIPLSQDEYLEYVAPEVKRLWFLGRREEALALMDRMRKAIRALGGR